MITHWRCGCGQYNAATLRECPKCGGRQSAPGDPPEFVNTVRVRAKREPNKLEDKYCRELLARSPFCDCRFEGLTFTLASGARYKPDWVIITPDAQIHCHEVKGKWESRDAKLRFREAAARWPMFKWVWAKWNGKQWKIEEVFG